MKSHGSGTSRIFIICYGWHHFFYNYKSHDVLLKFGNS